MNPSRPISSVPLAVILILAWTVAPVLAQEWNCHDGKETWFECFSRLRDTNTAEAPASDLEERRQAFLTGTGISTLGNATAKRGFLPGLFSALGVDGVSDRDGNLVLTYNSRRLQNGAHLSGEFVLNQAAVFEKFAMEIPADARDEAVKSLKSQLNDFDDIGFNFLLDTSGWSGWKGRLGHFVGDYSSEFQSPLFMNISDKNEAAHAKTIAANRVALALLATKLDEKVDKTKDGARELDTKLAEAATSSIDYSESLRDDLNKYNYFKLADLVTKQPQLYFTLKGKKRDKIVGPNSFMLSATYEHPIGASINGLRKFCGDQCTPERFSEYVMLNAKSIESKDRWRIDISVGQERPYDFSIPDPNVSLHLDKVNIVEATFSYGRSLIRDKEGKDLSRFDFEAKYEDTTGDKKRQNRLVGTATLTERLTDDMSFVLSAVWANNPAYRDTVNKDLSARAGLRYKIDRKSK